MQEKIKDVLDGKLKVSDLTPEELPEFVKAGQAEAEKARGEVTGLREAKRAESDRVTKLQEDLKKAEQIISEAKAAEESLKASRGEITQFRQEQIGKAKEKFFTTFNAIPEEDKPKVEEMFKRLDSGKVDADLIFKDFVSSYAAVNPDGYITATKKLSDMEKNAAAANAAGAEPSSSAPGSDKNKKFDEKTVKVATEAGITPEAADTVLKQGMTRKL